MYVLDVASQGASGCWCFSLKGIQGSGSEGAEIPAGALASGVEGIFTALH